MFPEEKKDLMHCLRLEERMGKFGANNPTSLTASGTVRRLDKAGPEGAWNSVKKME